MTGGKFSVSKITLDFLRQIEETERIGDGRAIPANLLRDLFLGERKSPGELTITAGFLDGIEVFALKIFRERQLERLGVGNGFNHGWDRGQGRLLAGAETAFTRDDFKAAPAIAGRTHDDGLENALFANGRHQFIQRFLRKTQTWLMGIGHDLRNRDLTDG